MGNPGSSKLKFVHSFDIEAAPKLVWSFLWNVQALTRCITGCEEVITRSENKAYFARIRRKVGPFLIRMELEIDVKTCVEPERIAVVVSGRDNKLRSKLSQELLLSLKGNPEGPSTVQIESDFELRGVLAALGKNLLRGHVRNEMNTFVENVRAGIEAFNLQQASQGETKARILEEG